MKTGRNDDDDDSGSTSSRGEFRSLEIPEGVWARNKTSDDAYSFLAKVREMLHGEEGKFVKLIEDSFLRDYKFKRNGVDEVIIMARMKELLKGRTDLIMEFNKFLPEGFKVPIFDEEEDQPVCFTLEEASCFLSKIQNSIASHVYQRLAIRVRMCAKGLKSMKKLHTEVAVLFAGQPDLIKIFEEFESSMIDRATRLEKKIEGKHSGGYEGLEFDDSREFYVQNLQAKRTALQKNEDYRANPSFVSNHYEDAFTRNVVRPLKVEDKYKKQKCETDEAKEKKKCMRKTRKSIPKLDLSICEVATPSYRFLPKDYPLPTTSYRTELGAQVLNDQLVSVPSGSENFKQVSRNAYEKCLDRFEDDMFELDMLLECVSSTIKQACELLDYIDDDDDDDDYNDDDDEDDDTVNRQSPICLKDHFKEINLRCIERVYGDCGLQVLEMLCKNPSAALPVILARLQQKQEEWTKSHIDLKKFSSGVYASTSSNRT